MVHDFYSVHEAAEDLGCTENDLLKLGINGTIDLYIWYEGQYQSPYDGEVHGVRKFIAISDADIMRVYQEHTGSPRLCTVNQKDDSVVTLKNVEQLPEASFKTVDLDIFPVVTSLFLMSATLDTLKAEIKKSSVESAAPCRKEDGKRISNLSDVIGQTATRSAKTRPDGTLTQAVKHLFHHLFENGEPDALKKANIIVFAEKMRGFVKKTAADNKKDTAISEYLSERIEKVQIAGKSITITTKEHHHPRKNDTIKIEKSETYRKEALEKRLKPLREGKEILD